MHTENFVHARILASRETCRDPNNQIIFGKLAFFHSMDEYIEMANKYHWTDINQRDHSWYGTPREVTVLVQADEYRRFKEGQTLSTDLVFISLNAAEEMVSFGK